MEFRDSLLLLMSYLMMSTIKCEDFGKSNCEPTHPPVSLDCGKKYLNANSIPKMLNYPTSRINNADAAGICLWSIRAKRGTFLEFNITELNSSPEEYCWQYYLKIYGGAGPPRVEKLLYSGCSKQHLKVLRSGWNIATVLFEQYGNEDKAFKLQYYSYDKKDPDPNIHLSFQPFLTCDVSVPNNTEHRLELEKWDTPVTKELLVYLCVYPPENLTNNVLSFHSTNLASWWYTYCEENICRIGTERLVPNLMGNYTFIARIRTRYAKIMFELRLPGSPSVHIHNYASLPYQPGSKYSFDCDVLGEPVPQAEWFFYQAENIYQCRQENLPPEETRSRLSKELLRKDTRNKLGGLYYVCEHGDYKLKLDLVTVKSGCLACWTWNTYGFATAVEPIPVSGMVEDLIISPSDLEAVCCGTFTLQCTTSAFDHAELRWTVKLENRTRLSGNELAKYDPDVSLFKLSDNSSQSLFIKFDPIRSHHTGEYICNGIHIQHTNKQFNRRNVNSQIDVIVLPGPVFDGLSSNLTTDYVTIGVFYGTNVTLNCSARGSSPLEYSWQKLDESSVTFMKEDTAALTVVLKYMEAGKSDQYQCIVRNEIRDIKRIFTVELLPNKTRPVFLGRGSNVTREDILLHASPGENVTLNCTATGTKPITYSWIKVNRGGVNVKVDNSWLDEEGAVVKFTLNQTALFEEESYICTVENQVGKISRKFLLNSSTVSSSITQYGMPGFLLIVIIVIVAVFLLCIIVGIGFLYKYWEKRSKSAAKPRNFPTRSSGPQEVSIPFDVIWEFPHQRLVLGEKIGQGAYGRVVKAQAFGIVPDQDVTTVAVKMLKANADSYQKKALFAELKILSRLGRHLNVVNLLGAVTKFQASGQMLILVEYCEKGSLYKYLLNQRQSFVCQINKETKKVDKRLCQYPFRKKNNGDINVADPNSTNLVEHSTVTSTKTVDTILSSTSATSSSSATNPPGTSQSISDPLLNETCSDLPLTTSDLLSFAFQCARGMEYIASRKLVHRDLSARNVLLTKDNIIKICDFGLTRDCFYLYNTKFEKKKMALPIRWMALESLGQNQFTSKSDVWSFGILLWEIFSLGETPYPGMAIDETFYQKLLGGYRLSPPETCPGEITVLMKDCWKSDPEARPAFSDIVNQSSELLDNQNRNYYLNLNAPFEEYNKRLEDANGGENESKSYVPEWLFPDTEQDETNLD